MKYITIRELSETIRNNIWKVPRDIDFIVGVPRSGMIAASIIASYLNVPLTDVNSFLAGLEPTGGGRLCYFNDTHRKTGKALVIDDTVYGGTSMTKVRQKLSTNNSYQFTYMCAYLEGQASSVVDIYLEDVRQYTDKDNPIVIYEWNIFQHNTGHMTRCLFDIDGVLCLEPPDERNEQQYLDYIANATPLFIPRTIIGGIVTYRLEKNRQPTEQWLRDNNIHYGELNMFPANSWQERHDKHIPPEKYKADFYGSHGKYKLFIESSDTQAQQIADMTHKPVYAVDTNKLYQ